MTSFVVNLKPAIDLSDDAFFELCRNNHELKFERDSKGNLRYTTNDVIARFS